MMEDGEEEENDDNYHQMFPEYSDTAMEEEEGDEQASVEPADDHSRVFSDAKRDCVTEKERLQFEQMLQDHDGAKLMK
jgi:hypothetical protein